MAYKKQTTLIFYTDIEMVTGYEIKNRPGM